MRSSKFEIVKKYYNFFVRGKRLWDITRVNKAVTDRWITEEEYQEITGEPYVPIN